MCKENKMRVLNELETAFDAYCKSYLSPMSSEAEVIADKEYLNSIIKEYGDSFGIASNYVKYEVFNRDLFLYKDKESERANTSDFGKQLLISSGMLVEDAELKSSIILV